jgi:hypothetical protein
MAGGEDTKSSNRRKHTAASRRSHKSTEKHDLASSSVATTSERPPDLDALRKARLDFLEKPPEERRKTMKYVYDAPISSKSRSTKDKDRRSTVSLARRKSEDPKKRRKRKQSEDREAQSDDGYVYSRMAEEGRSTRIQKSSKTRSRDHLAPKATAKKSATGKATAQREPPRRHTEPPQRRNSCPTEERYVFVLIEDPQAAKT